VRLRLNWNKIHAACLVPEKTLSLSLEILKHGIISMMRWGLKY